MNYQIVFKLIGRIMCVEAAFMIPAILIAAFNSEMSSVLGFSVAVFLLVGIGLPVSLRKPRRTFFHAREGFVIVGLTWIVVSLFGAVPFYVSGVIPGFADCVFESVSGFSTTGASVLTEIEGLPMSILYWRCFSNWLGGMGVLVFLLAIGPLSRDAGYSVHLLRAEATGPRVGKLAPRMQDSAKILYKMYIALTALQILMLVLGGEPLFDAVAIAFGTAGTGGFAIKNDSLASYSSYTIIVTTVFMILFSINFNVIYLVILRRFGKAFKSQELIVFLFVILVSAALIAYNIHALFESAGASVRHAMFQVVSMISTTAFSTADFNLWPQLSRCILLLLMIMGACAGSTGGGIKIIRVLIILKSVKRAAKSVLRPNSVNIMRIDDTVVGEDTVSMVYNYMMIYILILMTSVLLLSLEGVGFETSFMAVLNCLNNIGPGLGGAVGPAGSYAGFSAGSKLLLSLVMLFGRLEIFPILVLFTPWAWKK